MSAVIREKLARALKQKTGAREKKLTPTDFPWLGKYSSKADDVSERHDDYLAEEFL